MFWQRDIPHCCTHRLRYSGNSLGSSLKSERRFLTILSLMLHATSCCTYATWSRRGAPLTNRSPAWMSFCWMACEMTSTAGTARLRRSASSNCTAANTLVGSSSRATATTRSPSTLKARANAAASCTRQAATTAGRSSAASSRSRVVSCAWSAGVTLCTTGSSSCGSRVCRAR